MDDEELREVLDELNNTLRSVGLSWLVDQASGEVLRRRFGEYAVERTGTVDGGGEPSPRVVPMIDQLEILAAAIKGVARTANALEQEIGSFFGSRRIEFHAETANAEPMVVSTAGANDRRASLLELERLLDELLERARRS